MSAVSVILPNFNHARFLPERLATIAAQTFPDLDIVLLDDGSTDGSRAVLEEWARGRTNVRLVCGEGNTGNPFVQWNRGVALARGEFVWIAESDDAADPTLVAVLVDALRNEPDAVLAFCNSELVEEDGTHRCRWSESRPAYAGDRFARDFFLAGPAFLASLMVQDCFISNASCVLFRREAFLAAGGADESFRFCGDYATWVRLLGQGGVVYRAAALNRWRRHAASVSHRSQRDGRATAELYRVVGAIARQVPVPAEVLQRRFDELLTLWQEARAGGCGHSSVVLRAGFAADPAFLRRLLNRAVATRYARGGWIRPVVHLLARLGIKL